MLYQAYQLQSDLMSPLRLLAQGSSAALWLGKTEGSLLRKLSASMEVFSRLRLTHSRPAYGIASVKVGERDFTAWAVRNEVGADASYYARVKGSPDAILFMPFAEEADVPADVVWLT